MTQIGTLVVQLGQCRPAPAELPATVPGFVGRDAEVDAVLDAAAGPAVAAQLVGRPGVGKTALAVMSARTLRHRYPDGQIAVELRGHGGGLPASAFELIGRLLRSLDVADRSIPTNPSERVAHYRTILADRRVLILLDDATSAAQIRDALPPSDLSFAIITARRPIEGLGAGVTQLALPDLPLDLGRALIAAGSPQLDRTEALTELAHLCAGLPLALRIVAARLQLEPDLDPAALATALKDGLGVLHAGDRAVRASFALSYDRLDAAARQVFRRCAALDLPELPATAIAALSGLAPDVTVRATDSLRSANLLDGGPRYRLHDLLRKYARERLRIEDETTAIKAAGGRVCTAYLADLRDITRSLETARPWFAVEWDNLLTIAGHLRREDPEALQTLAELIVSEHDLHTPWDGWSDVQVAALEDARSRDLPQRQARLQLRLAIAHRERRQLETALDYVRGAESCAVRGADAVGAAFAVHAEAEIRRDRGEHDHATRLYARSIAQLEKLADAEAIDLLGWSWHGLGDVECARGQPASALRCHRKALRQFALSESVLGRAWVWHGVGDAMRRAGRGAAAAAAYRRSLAVHADVGNVDGAGWTRQQLGVLLLDLGDAVAAGHLFEEARAAAVARVDPYAEALATEGLGDAAAARDATTEALGHWSAALDITARLPAADAAVARGRLMQRLHRAAS